MNISTRQATSRRTARIAAALALAGSTMVVGALTAGPAEAVTALRGNVVCGASSDGPVVGIWVSTNAGGDGWASRSSTPDPMINSYSKSIPSGATKINVAVGCGGTPQRWARTYYGSISVSKGTGSRTYDWLCNNYYGSYRCL